MTTASSSLPSQRDLELLRQTIAMAQESRQRGRHPFAALVADESGAVLCTAVNHSMPPGDPTQHAELQAAAEATTLRTRQQLEHCTLYSSAEPCCMCAGAIYWCHITRVVYALSEQRLLKLTSDHAENRAFAFPCREVFARGQMPTVVLGPLLEDEAVLPHHGFWR